MQPNLTLTMVAAAVMAVGIGEVRSCGGDAGVGPGEAVPVPSAHHSAVRGGFGSALLVHVVDDDGSMGGFIVHCPEVFDRAHDYGVTARGTGDYVMHMPYNDPTGCFVASTMDPGDSVTLEWVDFPARTERVEQQDGVVKLDLAGGEDATISYVGDHSFEWESNWGPEVVTFKRGSHRCRVQVRDCEASEAGTLP